MVLLSRFVPHLADRANVWTLGVVLSLRAADVQREINSQVFRINRDGLSASDRKRGIASPCSGSRQAVGGKERQISHRGDATSSRPSHRGLSLTQPKAKIHR